MKSHDLRGMTRREFLKTAACIASMPLAAQVHRPPHPPDQSRISSTS